MKNKTLLSAANGHLQWKHLFQRTGKTELFHYLEIMEKKGPSTLLASWLFKHAECLTSLFCPSSFWALFCNHYTHWNSVQCFSYSPIQMIKTFGYIHHTSNSTLILSIPFKNASGFWLHYSNLLYYVQTVKFCWEFSFGLNM